MRHYIRTGYGVSQDFYTSTIATPLYGAGQGSTNGPFFWLLMFSIIMKAMDKTLRGLAFISAFTLQKVERFGDAFVDDSHFGVTSRHVDDPLLSFEDNIAQHERQCLEDMLKLGQHYERLLYSTGGALNIPKCSWTFITWRWHHGDAVMATIAQAPAELAFTSGHSQTLQRVPRLEASTGYRTLGCFISGGGAMTKAKSILRGHSESHADNIRDANLRPEEAYTAYTMFFLPKIKFSLPISIFTQAECRNI
jgi:hypothetical protein